MNTHNFNKKQSGFSLIELMVVVAIIAVLAAIAVPSYKSYVGRGYMAEVNGFIQAAMEKAAEYYINGGTAPTQVVTPGNGYIYTIDTTYPSSSTIQLKVVMGNGTNGKAFDAATFGTTATIYYWGTDSSSGSTNGAITWSCQGTGAGGSAAAAGISGGSSTAAVEVYFPNCT